MIKHPSRTLVKIKYIISTDETRTICKATFESLNSTKGKGTLYTRRHSMDLKVLCLNKINEMNDEISNAASQADNYSLYDLDTNTMQTLVDETNKVMYLDVIDLTEQVIANNQTDFEDIILCSDQYIDENISSNMNSLSFEDIKRRLENNNIEILKCNIEKFADQNQLVSDDENVDLKDELPDTYNESGIDILDLDKDTIQSLIKDNFMDIDFADLDGSHDSKDPDELDIEKILKVNKILKNTNETFNATIDKLDSGILEIEITPHSLPEVQQPTAEDSFRIISTDDTDSDSECEGYHSSDFEFITESEAGLQGLITNQPKNLLKNASSIKTSQNRTTRNTQRVSESSMPGTSRSNEHANQNTLKYWSRSYISGLRAEQYKRDLKIHRQTYQIPEGEGYLNLFRGHNTSTTVFLENKSVIPSACMQVNNRMGFSVMRPTKDDSEEDLDIQTLKEAEENAKKILTRYPTEHKKRSLRRRY